MVAWRRTIRHRAEHHRQKALAQMHGHGTMRKVVRSRVTKQLAMERGITLNDRLQSM
jgi:hypothetical protein